MRWYPVLVLVLLFALASCITPLPTDPAPEDPQDPAPPEDPVPDDPVPSDLDFTLFVDKDGVNGPCSDGYSRVENSLSRPFCSIQRAADLVEPGDAVRVERGVYEEYVSITRSGTVADPIVFSGVRGSDGEWLTVIRGGTLAEGWVLAPEVDPNGYGVYKADLGFRPWSMMVDNKSLMHVMPVNNGWLSFSPTHVRSEQVERVVFWDGIEGIYGYNVGTGETYVRFRNGDDPNGMQLYAAPERSGIAVENAGYVTISNFGITNLKYAISVSGSESSGVIIEENQLMNSETRVFVTDRANDVLIRNNLITIDWLSDEFRQGAWGGRSFREEYDDPILYQVETQFHLYRTPKDQMFRGVSIHLDSGSGHRVYDNTIGNGYSAITVGATQGVEVARNLIENSSSVAIGVYPGAVDLRVHDNEIRDVNIALRFQYMWSDAARSVHFYNNRMSSDPRAGSGTFFHEGYCNGMNPDTQVWLYHNTYSGHGSGIWSGCMERNDEGLPGFYVINNVVSSRFSFHFTDGWLQEGRIGAVDYNWLMTRPFDAPWLGSNNIVLGSFDGWIWAPDDRSFVLPANSPARNAGLDLSRPFVLGGVTHDPLPGMEPGYYSGSAPHMGAVQD